MKSTISGLLYANPSDAYDPRRRLEPEDATRRREQHLSCSKNTRFFHPYYVSSRPLDVHPGRLGVLMPMITFKPLAQCAILFPFLSTIFGQALSDTTLALVSARLAEGAKQRRADSYHLMSPNNIHP